jgi:hypothetical protein
MTNNIFPLSVSKSPDRAPSRDSDEVAKFNRRGLFVGGCPKSGTTLLLALLDGHPELVVLPEETHYLEQRAKYRALPDFQAKLRHLLTRSDLRLLDRGRFEPPRDACGMDIRDYLGFDYARFTRLAEDFVNQPGMNDSLLLSETIRAYVITMGYDWRNCVRWVEKTPSNVPCVDDLFRHFPEARLIQVVRDPRAVFASRQRRLMNRYDRHSKAHRLVREWNESSRQIAKLRERPNHCLVIRYEDLLLNSRTVLEEVCRFVGIQFLPVLLEPTRAGKQWQGNSSFYCEFSGIDTQPLDKWKNELTEDEIWWIELHCHEGMDIAGYRLQTNAGFSLARWAKRLPGESASGYMRARKSSLLQMAGLLEDCRYGTALTASRPEIDSRPVFGSACKTESQARLSLD